MIDSFRSSLRLTGVLRSKQLPAPSPQGSIPWLLERQSSVSRSMRMRQSSQIFGKGKLLEKSMLRKVPDTLRHLWQTSPFYRLTLMGRAPKQLAVIPTDPWPGDIKSGRLLLDGKFLIGEQIILINDLWMPQKACVDVLGDLHRFTWLRD